MFTDTHLNVYSRLAFDNDIYLPKVGEYTVGDFYQHRRTDGGIKLNITDDFRKLIIDPMKDMKLSLPNETALYKYALIDDANDTDMQNHFPNPGSVVIPVDRFLSQLKAMLEAQRNFEWKVDGLDIRKGHTNIFNVDLTDIGGGVKSIRIRKGQEVHHPPKQFGDEWLLIAVPPDFNHKRTPECSFFAPVLEY